MANKCPKTLGNKGLSGISAIGFTTGQRDDCNGELKKSKLYLTYSYLPDDHEISDNADDETDEEWFIEKSTYDPKKKKYKKEYSEEDHIIAMMKKMPLNEFKDLFGSSNIEISNDECYEYLFECYCAYCCPELDFFLFKNDFPNAEINEEGSPK